MWAISGVSQFWPLTHFLCLLFGSLKGFFELTRRPSRALDSPCALLSELQRKKDTVYCAQTCVTHPYPYDWRHSWCTYDVMWRHSWYRYDVTSGVWPHGVWHKTAQASVWSLKGNEKMLPSFCLVCWEFQLLCVCATLQWLLKWGHFIAPLCLWCDLQPPRS